jgi:hypothetical protein
MKLPMMHQIKLYPIEVRIYNRVQLVGESQGLDRSFDKHASKSKTTVAVAEEEGVKR